MMRLWKGAPWYLILILQINSMVEPLCAGIPWMGRAWPSRPAIPSPCSTDLCWVSWLEYSQLLPADSVVAVRGLKSEREGSSEGPGPTQASEGPPLSAFPIVGSLPLTKVPSRPCLCNVYLLLLT